MTSDHANEEERSALQALSSFLPAHFASTDLKQEELHIWGVDLSQLPNLDPGKTTALLKFLRARAYNVEAAADMLVACLKWRRDFDIAGLMTEPFPPALTALGHVLPGRDRYGCPITLNTYGNVKLEEVFDTPASLGRFIRWRVQLMESAVQLLDFDKGIDQVVQLHDYLGASMGSIDKRVKEASRRIIQLFQDNYPEMLATKYFINVPRVMEVFFGIFSSFADVKTRKKLIMVSSGNTRGALLDRIPPSSIPLAYGGNPDLSDGTWGDIHQVEVPAGARHCHTIQAPPHSRVHWYYLTTTSYTDVKVVVAGMTKVEERGEHGVGSWQVGELPDDVNQVEVQVVVDNTSAWFRSVVVHLAVKVVREDKGSIQTQEDEGCAPCGMKVGVCDG